MSQFKTAVCPVCQRTVNNGAYFDRYTHGMLMRVHPSAAVQIDVSSPTWEHQFVVSEHEICKGYGLMPELVLN